MEKDALARALHAAFDRFETPCVSVSVWDGEKELHGAQGLSDVERGISGSPDTIYCIGSSTKAFVATAIGILADEGRLSLDDPIRKHLPSFRAYDPYVTEHLTIRDMLCHRCGLPRHDFTFDNQPDFTPRQMAEVIGSIQPAYPLRYHFSYQNHMYMLASVVVEDLSGQRWGDFITGRILKPLGMDSTYIFGDDIPDEEPRKARPYESKNGVHTRLPYNYVHNAASAGSLYSTTRDMLKWLRFRLEGNTAILSDAMRRELHTPQMLIKPGEMGGCDFPEISATAYGLGWFVYSYRGRVLVHHGGAIDGFRSMQAFLPKEQVAVSVLTNSNSTEAVNSLCYTLLDLMLGETDADWNTRYRARLTAQREAFAKAAEEIAQAAQSGGCACTEPEAYTGVYTERAYGSIEVLKGAGGLVLRMGSGDYPLQYQGGDRFALLMEMFLFSFPVTFRRNDAGRVMAVDIPFEPDLPENPIHFLRK